VACLRFVLLVVGLLVLLERYFLKRAPHRQIRRVAQSWSKLERLLVDQEAVSVSSSEGVIQVPVAALLLVLGTARQRQLERVDRLRLRLVKEPPVLVACSRLRQRPVVARPPKACLGLCSYRRVLVLQVRAVRRCFRLDLVQVVPAAA
jgi:hypothetical protein